MLFMGSKIIAKNKIIFKIELVPVTTFSFPFAIVVVEHTSFTIEEKVITWSLCSSYFQEQFFCI